MSILLFALGLITFCTNVSCHSKAGKGSDQLFEKKGTIEDPLHEDVSL
jgi:hypothetical protein